MKNVGLLLMLIASCSYSQKMECYITGIKNQCWANYNVEITLTDLETKQSLISLRIPKGKMWSRTKFNCELGKVLAYSAKYFPVYWLSDKDKIFYSRKYWRLPNKLEENQKKLNITICFPDQFIGTPIPPESTGNCECDDSVAPEIKLKAN